MGAVAEMVKGSSTLTVRNRGGNELGGEGAKALRRRTLPSAGDGCAIGEGGGYAAVDARMCCPDQRASV